MNFIWNWLIKHWSSVAIGLILCWISIGVSYTTFFKRTVEVKKGGFYVEASDGFQPTLGCAMGSQYIGWAHQKIK